MWLEDFAAWMNRLIFFSRAGVGQAYPLRVGRLRCGMNVFCHAKGQRDFKSTLAFLSEP